MREILFRGKRIDDGEWVYGDLIICGTKYYYIKPRANFVKVENNIGKTTVMREVVPETVGQYTGLTDRNGKKIFEGDIVKALVIYNERFQDSVKKVESVYEIKYHKKYCYFYLARKNINVLFDGNWNYGVTGYEVIGNIHDNPELVRGEEE